MKPQLSCLRQNGAFARPVRAGRSPWRQQARLCYEVIVVPKAQPDWKTLGRLKTLSWLSQDQLQGLAQSLTLERIKRRDTIFFEGESSNRIYVLLSGVAKLSFQNRDERVLVGLVGPGEIFG